MFHSLLEFTISGLAESPGISFELVFCQSRTHLLLKCWTGDRFISFILSSYDRYAKSPDGELQVLSQFLSCFKTVPTVVGLVNFPAYFKKVLDKYLSLTTKITLVPVFSFEDLKTHIRAPITQFYGKADLFSLVDYLVIRLQSASSEPWITDSTHLRIVSVCFSFRIRGLYKFPCIIFATFRLFILVFVTYAISLTFLMNSWDGGLL